MGPKRFFTEHPRSVEESYGQHLSRAVVVSRRLWLASIFCFIHGLIPALFVTRTSKTIKEIYDETQNLNHSDEV